MQGVVVEQEQKQSTGKSNTKELASRDTENQSDQSEYKARRLVNSVGLFLWEQRARWILYVWILLGAAAGGGTQAPPTFSELATF
jgi:hypothetical protein